ncbi:hypothetical protein [Methylocapsa aurea]|uniref:hypothetical protein n=1 Tax=Methylocapsa aurea TaxID=663610 RepID=UPI00055DC244|nr:hypothetical protein [Methylocapsa aurea]
MPAITHSATFDRSTIMRTAHAAAKARMAPSKSYRYGDRIDRKLGMYVAPFSYREAFAAALKQAWREAKAIAQSAALAAAAPSLTADEAARVRDLEVMAWRQPVTRRGNDLMRDLQAEAQAIRTEAQRRSNPVAFGVAA